MPYIEAVPSEANILEWHYVLTGPPDTPYAGGEYHGTLVFPADYPFKPPAIRMITPSGRFLTNQRLCLSISDYHPKSWNPAWSVSTILTGLLSFMVSDEHTAGSTTSTTADKRIYAQRSHEWNTKRNDKYKEHFPHLINSPRTIQEAAGEAATVATPPNSNGAQATDNSTPASVADQNSATAATKAANSESPAAPKKQIEEIPTRKGGHGQTILYACVLLASWVVASRFISH